MFKWFDGMPFYVVEFDEMPELPIHHVPGEEGTIYFALALEIAIETGVITEPGKYAFGIHKETMKWDVYKLIE